MICHWKGCGQWDLPWTQLPAAAHPCSSAITHLPSATEREVFLQHQNKKKMPCIDGDFFFIQENMEPCLSCVPEIQVKQIHKVQSLFCGVGGE